MSPRFQCRERHGWDFYSVSDRRAYDLRPVSVPRTAWLGFLLGLKSGDGGNAGKGANSFSAANGMVGISTCRTQGARHKMNIALWCKFQCRERHGWDFYPAVCRDGGRRVRHSRFSAANGMVGISTGSLATCICKKIPILFQCRERHGWDFYSRFVQFALKSDGKGDGFSAANGMVGISTPIFGLSA